MPTREEYESKRKAPKLKAGWYGTAELSDSCFISASAITRYRTRGLITKENWKYDDKSKARPKILFKHPEWAYDVNNNVDRKATNVRLYLDSMGMFIPQEEVPALSPDVRAADKIETAVETRTEKQNLEFDKLSLANEKERIQIAKELGELVRVEDVEAKMKNFLANLRKQLDDMPYKIAEKAQKANYEKVLEVSKVELNKIFKKVSDGTVFS